MVRNPELSQCRKAHDILNVGRTALIFGILYLAFQGYPVIFMEGHGFNFRHATYWGIFPWDWRRDGYGRLHSTFLNE